MNIVTALLTGLVLGGLMLLCVFGPLGLLAWALPT